MRNTKLYVTFLVLTIIFTLAGVITLIPSPHDPDMNFLGYKSMCSWAPWSTLICFLLAGISCKIRKKKFK